MVWQALHERSRSSSLCNLCVLCVSVVVFFEQFLTTEAQRTQRLHREEVRKGLFMQSRSNVSHPALELRRRLVFTLPTLVRISELLWYEERDYRLNGGIIEAKCSYLFDKNG